MSNMLNGNEDEDKSSIQRAYMAQVASQRQLYLHRWLFKIQHQRWYRFRRDRLLIADFEINTDGQRIGLFAELIWLLYAIWYAESIGAKPCMRVTSSSYSRVNDGHTDYLQQFFDPKWPKVAREDAFVIRKRITSLNQLPRLGSRTTGLNLWRANTLVRSYLPLQQNILDEANLFASQNLGSSYLAVHWRGTDKSLEAEPVTLDRMVQTILKVYNNCDAKPTHLFLASDQQDLIDQLNNQLLRLIPSLRCAWRTRIARSLDNRPIHLRDDLEGEQRYQLGRDALIDSLILSQSRGLIRTSSFLSAWCSIWNPVLPVYMVNHPNSSKCWFPDSEILLASNYFNDQLSSQ